ncbi:MAG: VCBS repeat-containing protein [Verrucomicrobia bacterium]|nr:VCBS repeat-containing protein [Verrucomicrobiota bacterium]
MAQQDPVGVKPTPLRQKIAALAVGLLLLLAGGIVTCLMRPDSVGALLGRVGSVAGPASSERAFNESYLDALAGKDTTQRTSCVGCHSSANDLVGPAASVLDSRSKLSRAAWARAIPLAAKCGICHVVPDPAHLPRQSWSEAIARMEDIMEIRNTTKPTAVELQDVLHFYLTFSRENQPRLADDPAPARSPSKFEASVLGQPVSTDPRERPVIGNVSLVDLDRDGRLKVLACDTRNSAVTWLHNSSAGWTEVTLAKVPFPARARVVTADAPENLNLAVACLGAMGPTDAPVGSVVLLVNDGARHFWAKTILDGVGRVADVEPGDFDGDGDVDFVVAAYGFINQGEVGWLENSGGTTYAYHRIVKRTGAMNVPAIDLNDDWRLDFVALFAQEHEQISAFLNDGQGGFREQVLFKAATPSFGSSGLELVDLDKDGDTDILYTNGDNMDLPTMIPRPYHGVQWLENRGGLSFVWHDIHRCYGPYCAATGDLNNDGHLDIVVTSMFNDWSDTKRASLIWLENDGQHRFTPRGIARQPIHLLSAAVGDLDGDGWADIAAGGMNGFPPFERMGRITLWKNRHTRR